MSISPGIKLLNTAYCGPVLNHFFRTSIAADKNFLKDKRDGRQITKNVRQWDELHAILERFNNGEELTQDEHRIISAGVFQTQMAMEKVDKKTGVWSPTTLTHNNHFSYLIVQEHGYHAQIKTYGATQLSHVKDSLLPYVYGKFSKKTPGFGHPMFGLISPKSVDPSALVQFIRSWHADDKKPFIVFDFCARPIDYDAIAISYDHRHVHVNSVINRVVDMSQFLVKKEVQDAEAATD